MSEDAARNSNAGKLRIEPGRVFSIPPGAPFLKTLAAALVEGRLVEGFKPEDDPFILSKATIYLPTRRAARALGDEFLSALGANASLLPRILTFGDSGEEEEFNIAEPANPAVPVLRDAISVNERRKCLSFLIGSWAETISQDSLRLFGEEDIVIPSSTAEAVRMAGDLARLFDQVESEEIPWEEISQLANTETDEHGRPAAWAHWWNLTLQFLDVVSKHWPSMLQEMELSDPAERRRLLLDLRTQHYLNHGSDGPVVAAGSTGSVPATARLITAISRLENGAVVLPGLDSHAIDSFGFEQEKSSANGRATEIQPALAAHPQAALSRLIHSMNLPAELIGELGDVDDRVQARTELISLTMTPAHLTGQWAQTNPSAKAVENLAIIEAEDDREEALAIAVAMREALETEGKTAALTTPDRSLARRVAAELRRFNITVDDSGGTPLSSIEVFRFSLLLLDMAHGPPNAVNMAALIKHRLLCGEADSRASALSRLFEIAVLRDAITLPAAGNLAAAIQSRRLHLDTYPHAPAQIRNMEEEDWQEMTAMAEAVDHAMQPLLGLAENSSIAFGTVMAALRESLHRFIAFRTDADETEVDGFDFLVEFIDGFADSSGRDLKIHPAEAGSIYSTFASDTTLRQAEGAHPRLFIWGPLEARLQSVDLMVLGGLNEGTWPVPGKNDPFLNRPMKAALGMLQPERRIGLSAHDFQQLSGQAEVIYSRAKRSANAPTIASRWLQRLTTVAGADLAGQMQERGQHYIKLARLLDAPIDLGKGPTGRPCPKPALALRPTRLSITEIERWIRDPYAIFARHVLGLSPLPMLVRTADPILRGSVFHKIVERFVTEDDIGDPRQRIAEVCNRTLKEFDIPDDVAGVWRKRFDAIAELFIEWEENRKPSIRSSHCELSGAYVFPDTGFELRGRADRIDEMTDESFTIIDYKTGSTPSIKQARTLSPQLALEAKMAELGAFAIPEGLEPGEISYVRLRPDTRLKIDRISGSKDKMSAQELADDAWARLQEMIKAFSNPDQGYQSRRAPFREGDITGDYDHLARTREWMVSSDGAEEDDG
ncbi:MAG: double-strand break repair protein AddB [Rhizobiaceae bacterium]